MTSKVVFGKSVLVFKNAFKQSHLYLFVLQHVFAEMSIELMKATQIAKTFETLAKFGR